MKLLLVEDHAESAQLLVRFFKSVGYDVVHKTHGLEGLRAARASSFDAILLDFNLPDIDGAQVGLVMHPVFKHTPIIALTAQDDRATRNKAKHFGFDAFVGKPWSMIELLATVQEHISRRTQKIIQ